MTQNGGNHCFRTCLTLDLRNSNMDFSHPLPSYCSHATYLKQFLFLRVYTTFLQVDLWRPASDLMEDTYPGGWPQNMVRSMTWGCHNPDPNVLMWLRMETLLLLVLIQAKSYLYRLVLEKYSVCALCPYSIENETYCKNLFPKNTMLIKMIYSCRSCSSTGRTEKQGYKWGSKKACPGLKN
jgi:hypothetical protein